MLLSYISWTDKESPPLYQTAGRLFAQRPRPSRLSPLVLMTDARRVDHPLDRVKALRPGAAVIYRHFGKDDRLQEAEQLRQASFAGELQFLIGDDPDLAIAVGADGVHFRRDAQLIAPMLWRRRCPHWLITMAALKGAQEYDGDLQVLDGLFLSSIFASGSPSAGRPIGTGALGKAAAELPVPVFALGGITAQTAPGLIGSGAAGIAGVSGLV